MSKSFASLERSLQKAGKQPRKVATPQSSTTDDQQGLIRGIPAVLLPYQQRWTDDQLGIKIAVKSRRIGLSWCDAADSTLEAARSNGRNTFYLGYNREMALEYIQACADWAAHYSVAVELLDTEGVILEDEKDIIAYRITFASGFMVQALSSTPRNIRSKGRPGDRLRIDEFAFHDNPEELLKAAIAFKMWGGKIAIWSTHNGKNSFFNKLIEEIKEGKRPFSLHHITLQDALNEGLYKRICLINGEQWGQEKQNQWVIDLRAEYGQAALEELDCIPADWSSVKLIDRDWYQIVTRYDLPYCDRFVRFWDLAATQADITKKKKPCNTAGVLLGYSTATGQWVILDCLTEAFNPSNTDQLMLAAAVQDGDLTPIAHELEGGASGIRDSVHIKNLLNGFTVAGIRPQGDKILRGKNFITSSKNGKIFILQGDWNEDFLEELDTIPNGLMDRYDAVVGAYNYLSDGNVITEMASYFED